MNRKTALCVCPAGADANLQEMLSATGWELDIMLDLHELRDRQRNSAHRVGLMVFDQLSDAVLAEIEQCVAAMQPMVWVALIPQGASENRRLGKLIYDKFYDYLTLPIDRNRLLFTLGHAHGMAVLYENFIEDENSQWKQAKADLTGLHDELRRLTLHLQSVREEERARIAREIHDDMGQSLTGLKYELRRLQTGLLSVAPGFDGEIDAMIEMVDAMMDAVQRICADLRPALLDDLGLSVACEWELERFRSHTGVDCQFSCDWDQEMVQGKNLKTALFRIFQEALTNVARHAQASEVGARLAKEDDKLILEIFDNGIGISDAATDDRTALGIIGMRERARGLGGEVTVTALPDHGTRVRCIIPCKATPADGAPYQNHGVGRWGGGTDPSNRLAL